MKKLDTQYIRQYIHTYCKYIYNMCVYVTEKRRWFLLKHLWQKLKRIFSFEIEKNIIFIAENYYIYEHNFFGHYYLLYWGLEKQFF